MFAWIELVRYLNWVAVQKTIAYAINKRLTGLAAEMAFSAMLGLFPAIIAVLTAISLFENSVESTLVSLAVHFADIVPIQVWTLLLNFIEEIRTSESKSWVSLSTLTAIWIISGVLTAAINALDQIHQVTPERRRTYLQTKLVALALTILTIALLVIACFLLWVGDFLLQVALQQNWTLLLLAVWKIFSVIIVMAIAAATTGLVYQFRIRFRNSPKALDSLKDLLPGAHRDRQFRTVVTSLIVIIGIVSAQLVHSCYLIVENWIVNARMEVALGNLLIDLWRLLGFPLALGIIAIAFSLIYCYGASERVKNTPIFPGAALAAILWVIVSLVFRLYVSHVGVYSKIYGAVGTAIILMLWLYLSSLVMLIGEQLNVVLGEAIAEEQRELRPN